MPRKKTDVELRVAAEFAKRLKTYITAKGYNYAEFARRVQEKMPAGKPFGRDAVSTYVAGTSVPGAVRLKAILDTLDVKKEQLIPDWAAEDEHPPFDMRALEDGRSWVRINQPMSQGLALKIMSLIHEEQEKERK